MSTGRGLSTVLAALRARWWIVVLCALVAGAAAYGARELREDQYRASASVLFRSTNLDASVLNGTPYFDRSDDPLRVAATNFELVQSPTIAARVVRALGGGPGVTGVEGMMSFREVGNSDVVEISATSESAAEAALVANTWAEQFVAYRRQSDRGQVAEAIALIRRELEVADADSAPEDARIQDLRQTLARLRVVQALQTGGAELIDTAEVPETPVGLPLILVLVGATAVGALLGAAAATFVHRRDRRLKTSEDVAGVLDLPVLASVPRMRGGGTSGLVELASPETREAFRTLALRLRLFDVDRARKVVAVVSAESGEGKTSIALQLGATYAAMGSRVVVVDCDFRRGDLRLRLPLDAGPGLVEVLSGQATVADAIAKVEFDAEPGGADGGPKATLYAIPAGATPPNPIQMLSSNAMREVLAALRTAFDHVVLDTAPLLRVSDTEALMEHVDGLVVVTRIQHSTTDDLRKLAGMLGGEPTRALGVVVNEVGRRETGRAYYGTAGPPTARERVRR